MAPIEIARRLLLNGGVWMAEDDDLYFPGDVPTEIALTPKAAAEVRKHRLAFRPAPKGKTGN